MWTIKRVFQVVENCLLIVSENIVLSCYLLWAKWLTVKKKKNHFVYKFFIDWFNIILKNYSEHMCKR